jgi:Asp-tRNA(Asn)/Glu-tRNA(Gln) amidotransferase C subunit
MENEEITPSLLYYLLELAAIEPDVGEMDILRRELNRQLRVIKELEGIKIEDDDPISSHGVPYIGEMMAELRDDEINTFPHPNEILAQAVETRKRYIIVPDIPHKDINFLVKSGE